MWGGVFAIPKHVCHERDRAAVRRLPDLPDLALASATGRLNVPNRKKTCTAAMTMSRLRGLSLLFGLIVLSEPVVRMLFEHGAFTPADTTAT